MAAAFTYHMLEELLRDLREGEPLELKESWELEFKESQAVLSRSLWETVSAFANTYGGWIILGVKEQENEVFVVVGVNNASKTLQELNLLMNNTGKVSYPAGKAYIVTVGGKELIVVRVRRAPRSERPVFIENKRENGTYRRVQSADVLCSQSDLDRMIRDSASEHQDQTILAEFGLTDIDNETLAHYRRQFQTVNPGSSLNNLDDQDFLKRIGAYKVERESKVEGLTIAGLLMFGTEDALRDWRGRHLIDYKVMKKGSNTEWEHRVAWKSNLFGAYEAIFPHLIQDLPEPFRLKEGIRTHPAQDAMREALINLLVHADYSDTRPSIVTKSDEGFLFRNPGASLVSAADMVEGSRSEARNPQLLDMFRRVKLAEEGGSGIPRIFSSWRDLNLAEPAINNDMDRQEFSIALTNTNLFSKEDRLWLNTLGGPWNREEELALTHARRSGFINNQVLQKLANIHSGEATKILTGLRDMGFLRMESAGGNTYYVLRSAPRRHSVPSTQLSLGLPTNGDAAPPTNEGVVTISDTDWHILEEVAQPVREQVRMNRADLDRVVVELCSYRPLSRRDLVKLLKRKEIYVGKIVRRLTELGRVGYLYSDVPNHPFQRYIALPIVQSLLEVAATFDVLTATARVGYNYAHNINRR